MNLARPNWRFAVLGGAIVALFFGLALLRHGVARSKSRALALGSGIVLVGLSLYLTRAFYLLDRSW